MKRQLITILIGILWTIKIHGQVQNDVKKVLAKMDFIEFKKYADNLSNKENMIIAYWECMRDLTADFQEGVFNIQKSIPDKDNPAICSVYTYKVTIITTKTNIAYCALSEKKNKKVGNDWELYDETIFIFRDDIAYSSLKHSFKSLYQLDLNENELFVTDFVYGSFCGLVGTNPKGRQQINEWIKAKNKTEILVWLKSTNTEKQVYAIDGLNELKKIGVTLTDDEKVIINFICNKNGTMNVCSGCIHTQQDIRKVTNNFKQ